MGKQSVGARKAGSLAGRERVLKGRINNLFWFELLNNTIERML
jgi:hypothetical protein